MHIGEPREDNSGTPQGVFLKRHTVLTAEGLPMTFYDIKVRGKDEAAFKSRERKLQIPRRLPVSVPGRLRGRGLRPQLFCDRLRRLYPRFPGEHGRARGRPEWRVPDRPLP